MSEINDGGSAFPEPGLACLPNGEFIHGRSGMTLRDYFAAKAVAALIAEPEWEGQMSQTYNIGPGTDDVATNYAVAAYRIADAMLAAREVKP